MPDEAHPRLSFRENAVGGPVRINPLPEEFTNLQRTLNAGVDRGLILLIHGYNNNQQDAARSYIGFRDRQRELSGLPINRPLADNREFVEIYWPGDANWGVASALFYMGSIANAQHTAEALADTIGQLASNRPTPLHIEVIAHSMGCRLTLALLNQLIGRPNIKVLKIALMAAALPTFMLEPNTAGTTPRNGYDRMLSGGAAQSLYSSCDMVLAIAFPLGQTLAPGPEGFFPTALGHEKWATPTVPGNLVQHEVPQAGHSDYWGWRTGPEALKAAHVANGYLHDFLRLAGGGDRTAPKRSLPERETVEARETTTVRETPEHLVGDE